MATNQNSTACRVIIVEDEPILALSLEDMLTELGYVVIGLATRIEKALTLARCGEFELAILDINLAGTTSFPVADILRDRGKPFIFTTGYGAQGVGEAYLGTPLLTKPYSLRELDQMLSKTLAQSILY